MNIYFNDANPAKIEELKQTLAERGLMTGPYKIHFFSQDFIPAFDSLSKQMLDSANLLLLDQHGVRFFTAQVFQHIRSLPFTDTLVFMSAS